MPSTATLHITHIIYALKTGGLENGLVNLINGLSEETFKHSIICLTDYDDFSKRIRRSDVDIISLQKKPGQDFNLYLKLYKTLKSLQPDIVHTRNMAAIEAQIPAFMAGVKIRVHGEHGWDISDPQGKNKKYQWIRKFCSLFIHQFIPLSKELESYLRQVIHVSANKITLICNGVDAVKFIPAKHQDKTLIPESAAQNAIVIGYVGRMEAIKDPVNLVKAFIQVKRETKKQVFLLMVGQGRQYETIKQLLVDAKLVEQCWLPGDCSNIPELMQCIDVFCLPSKAEGISNTLLEAMATGLPVVATKVGGNADIAIAGKTSLMVESENSHSLAKSLSLYVEDESLRKEHGLAGRERIEQELSLQQMISNYEKMYLDVTKKIKTGVV